MKDCNDLKELFDFMKEWRYTFENGIPKELTKDLRVSKIHVIEEKPQDILQSVVTMVDPPFVTIHFPDRPSQTFKLKKN